MKAMVKRESADRFPIYLGNSRVAARKSLGAAIRFAKARGAEEILVDTREYRFSHRDELGRIHFKPVDGTGEVYTV